MGSLFMEALFNPSEEHKMLRQMLAEFVKNEVEKQAEEYDHKEEFNLALFRQLGELGLLGITADDNHGGSGLDATAAVNAPAELS